MPIINSNNVKIYYDSFGTGKTAIVFLHGFSADRRMWDEQAEYFSNKRRVIIPDARGHGKSEAPVSNYSREDRANDLQNLVDHLKLDKFHLVGLSMGGGDAICFALDHQDRLLSLSLAGTVAAGWKPKKRLRDFAGLAEEIGINDAKSQYIESTLVHYKNRSSQLRAKLEIMIKDFSGMPWLDPMKGKYPIRDELILVGKLNIPTLILVGQKDMFFRPLAEQLNEKIQGSKLEIFKDIGHMVNMEAPEKFNRTLETFIEAAERKLAGQV